MTAFAAGGAPEALATGDFNGDSDLDLAVERSSGTRPSASSSATAPAALPLPADYAVGNQPHSIATGDFDGDGVTDLAVANWAVNNSVSVLLGKRRRHFRRRQGGHSNPVSGLSVPSASR